MDSLDLSIPDFSVTKNTVDEHLRRGVLSPILN